MKAAFKCDYAFYGKNGTQEFKKGDIVDAELVDNLTLSFKYNDRIRSVNVERFDIIDKDEWNEKLAEYKAKIDATKRRDMVVIGESIDTWAKGWDGQNNDGYEDTLITGIQKLLSCGGNEIIMVSLERWDYVYLLYKDGVLVDFISVYDEGGFEVNEKKGFVVIWGHEDVHILWVEDLEANRYATR